MSAPTTPTAPAATGTPTNGPAPTPGSAPDWSGLVNSLPEPIRGAPSLKNAKSFEDFASQHLNLEKTLGTQRLPKPQPGWTEKEWSDLHNQLGNPDKPDAYDFKGIELGEEPETKELLGKFSEVFAKGRLSNGQARMLVEAWQSMATAQEQARDQAVQASFQKVEQELKGEWGGEYDKKLEHANKAAQKLFGEKLEDFRQIQMADGSYLGDHPLMLRLLVALEEASVEGQLPAGRGNGSITGEAAQSQLNAFLADPENHKALHSADHPRHKEAVEERARLQALVTGQAGKSHYSPIGLG